MAFSEAPVWPRLRVLLGQLAGLGAQRRQRGPLTPVGVEVLGRQPRAEGRADRRPLAVEDREPRRVAVAPLDDHVLAEHALRDEAEAQRRGLRPLVGRVALPLQPPVAERLEGVARQQEDRLGRLRRALQRTAEPDVTDLDHAVRGLNAQEAHDAGGRARTRRRRPRRSTDRSPPPAPQMPREALVVARERPVGQVLPEPRVGAVALSGGVQRVAVTSGVEPLEHHALAHDRGRVRQARGRREAVEVVAHRRSELQPGDVRALGPALAQEALELARDDVAGGQVRSGSASAPPPRRRFSRRSTKACTSGSLWTASETWRS